MRLPLAPRVLRRLPALASSYQVSGAVGDIEGTPLVDAALEVVREGDGKVVAKRQVDAEGHYAFEPPAGRYLLRVREPSLCADLEQGLEVKEAEDVTPATLHLRRCMRVAGRAFGVDGAPLAGGYEGVVAGHARVSVGEHGDVEGIPGALGARVLPVDGSGRPAATAGRGGAEPGGPALMGARGLPRGEVGGADGAGPAHVPRAAHVEAAGVSHPVKRVSGTLPRTRCSPRLKKA